MWPQIHYVLGYDLGFPDGGSMPPHLVSTPLNEQEIIKQEFQNHQLEFTTNNCMTVIELQNIQDMNKNYEIKKITTG